MGVADELWVESLKSLITCLLVGAIWSYTLVPINRIIAQQSSSGKGLVQDAIPLILAIPMPMCVAIGTGHGGSELRFLDLAL